jgi:uncharacterized protein (TIGR02246 family)
VPATDILTDVMDRWKAAIDTGHPERMAEIFTADTVFQGLRPYAVGRTGVVGYYRSQPIGMTVDYRLLETRRLAAEVVLGYLTAEFSFPDRPAVGVNLGVVVQQEAGQWRIAFYEAAPAISSVRG